MMETSSFTVPVDVAVTFGTERTYGEKVARDHLAEAHAQHTGVRAAQMRLRAKFDGIAKLFGVEVAASLRSTEVEMADQIRETCTSYEAAIADRDDTRRALILEHDARCKALQERDDTHEALAARMRALFTTIVEAERKRHRAGRPWPEWFEAAVNESDLSLATTARYRREAWS